MIEEVNKKSVLRIAGAFVAWVIGSGFATGQEILQFFASYGYWGYGAILINLLGFLAMGTVLTRTGFEHRYERGFNLFKVFCGDKLGTFYYWVVIVVLIPLMSVLIAGAGATLSEYYDINHVVGSIIMAVLVYIVYLIGFERFVKIAGIIGPTIVAFCMAVGVITLIRDFENLSAVEQFSESLAAKQTSPNWVVSGVLYLSLNVICGCTYFTGLGTTAGSVKNARYGVILGTFFIMTAIAVINTAILTNAGDTASLDIPNLYLAKKISFILGALFSVFLIAGIFSSCSAMMWSVCSRFATGEKKTDAMRALLVSAVTLGLGILNFSDLLGTLYPIFGYIGLIFTFSVIAKAFRRGKNEQDKDLS